MEVKLTEPPISRKVSNSTNVRAELDCVILTAFFVIVGELLLSLPKHSYTITVRKFSYAPAIPKCRFIILVKYLITIMIDYDDECTCTHELQIDSE